MKTPFTTMLVAGLLAGFAITADAQNLPITFDESGNGTFGTNTLTSGVALESFSGMTTLVYFLPFPGVPGDVELVDADGTASDVLRWDGFGHLFVFSDNSDVDPITPPADVGLPAPVAALNRLTMLENGPEAGPNGLFNYVPGINDPGANTAGAFYNFISDPAPVPEPGTLALFAVGLGLLGLRARHQKHLRS